MHLSTRARITYYRLVRKVRRLYDPEPSRLQRLVGVAEELFPVFSPKPRGMRKEVTRLAELQAERLYAKSQAPSDAVLLFLHGGAFVFGSPKSHRSMAGYLGKVLGCEVLVPAYALSPEHTYPTQSDQVWSCYKALVAKGKRVMLAGDSAGGNLAVGVAQRAHAEGMQQAEALLLFSPWLDLRPNSAASQANQQADSLFDAEDMFTYASLYCGPQSPDSPTVSPLLAETTGLPPVFLQGAKNEFLWPDMVAWHSQLLASQVTVEFDVEEEAFHSWQLFPTHSSRARSSLNKAAAFAKEHISSSLLP